MLDFLLMSLIFPEHGEAESYSNNSAVDVEFDIDDEDLLEEDEDELVQEMQLIEEEIVNLHDSIKVMSDRLDEIADILRKNSE